MSIFVNPNIIFEVKIKYSYIYNEQHVVTGVEVHPFSNEASIDKFTLICSAVGRDAGTMLKVKEAATVMNHITGEPLFHTGILYKQIILNFFRSWETSDNSYPQMPIEVNAVNMLHDNVAEAIAMEWLKATGGIKE